MALTVALTIFLVMGLLGLIAYFLGVGGVELIVFVTVLAGLFVGLQYAVAPLLLSKLCRLRDPRSSERWLVEDVKMLAEQAGVPPPEVKVARDPTPNAFVFGWSRSRAFLVVHEGLLDMLDRDEVRAVIGHELGHVRHRDFVILTLLSVIPVIAYFILRVTPFVGWEGGDQDEGFVWLLLIGLIALVVYLASQLLILALSRCREYYADAHSAQLTGRPQDLINALSKISYGMTYYQRRTASTPGALRAFYIIDPAESKELQARDERLRYYMERERRRSRWVEPFLTHPPTYKRIAFLKKLAREMGVFLE